MMSSKNKPVCICALSNLTSQIVFDAWRVSMNVVSKLPSAWNDSRHAPSWWLYLHCRIEETGSPGIVCIVCHQVLRHPSKHGTSWIGKHLPAKAHIGKLQKSTESEITELTRSTVDETALAIPRSSVSNGSSFGPGGYYRSAWQRPYPIKNRRFFKRTITLRPQILIREYSVWYVKYAALHGASFGCLRFSISLNLSKRQPKNLVFTPKMTIISEPLAEF